MTVLTELRSSRELIRNLTAREVKGKYKSTVLGQLWSLVNPFASMLVYTIVFSLIIRIRPDQGDPSGLDVFAVWLLCALLPWNFFTSVVNGSIATLVGNENLVKKVYFPRWALVFSTALAALYQWCIEMLVLIAVLVVLGADVWRWLPLVAVAMAVMLFFALGFGLLLSIANVYFRDMQHLVSILFQVWFYMTPIVYPVSQVMGRSQDVGPLFGDVTILDLYRLNPMYAYSEVFRNLLYDNRLPSGGTVLECLLWAGGMFLIGFWVFQRHQNRLAEVL